MKTPLSEIVSFDLIGKTNSLNQHEILAVASKENIPLAKDDLEKVVLLGIDMQNDFMENGSLGVPGAHDDTKNLLNFMYNNLNKITDIILSIDTHQPCQIFHPLWWVDNDGNQPEPYTIITNADVQAGKWRPIFNEKASIQYLQQLEELGKKQLCIWPYHCIEGTFGHSLESQFANLVYFHSVVRQSPVTNVLKGTDPLTEMYGIFKPEVSTEQTINVNLLKRIATYDKIIVAGQAKSHCVIESIGQMLEYFNDDKGLAKKIYLLEDCTSSIPGFAEETEEMFSLWKEQLGVNLIESTKLTLSK